MMLKQLNFVWFKPFILPTNRIKWTIQNTQFIFTVSREEAKNPFNKKSTWITMRERERKSELLYQFHHALFSLFSRWNKYLRNKNSFNFRCITFYLHIKLNSTMKRWEQQKETKSGAGFGQRKMIFNKKHFFVCWYFICLNNLSTYYHPHNQI